MPEDDSRYRKVSVKLRLDVYYRLVHDMEARQNQLGTARMGIGPVINDIVLNGCKPLPPSPEELEGEVPPTPPPGRKTGRPIGSADSKPRRRKARSAAASDRERMRAEEQLSA